MTNSSTPRPWLALKVPPLLLVLLCALLILFSPALWAWAWPYAWWVGTALGVLGAGVCMAGVLTFRQAQTTVNPVTPDAASTLVVQGIYRYSRNPMYLGFALGLLGLVIALGKGSGLGWWMLWVDYLQRYQIQPEEQILHAKFGPPYADYCAQVGRWWTL